MLLALLRYLFILSNPLLDIQRNIELCKKPVSPFDSQAILWLLPIEKVSHGKRV